MFFGVEDVVRQSGFLQKTGNQLGVFDAGGTDEDGLSAFVAFFDVFDDGLEFFFGRTENLVVEVFALYGAVGRDDDGFEVVDALELESLGIGGTGHAGKFGVQAEVVLEGDGGEGLVFAFDFHAFFGFDGLVQAFGPAAAGHQTTCKFVNDDDFAVLDDVVLIFVEQRVRAQCCHEVVHQGDVGGGVERVVFLQQTHLNQDLLGVFVTRFAQDDLVCFFIDPVIAFAFFGFLADEVRGKAVHDLVQLDVVIRLPGDNQRGTRFVDQNGVHFVHYGKIQFALNFVVLVGHHVVAQVVEAEFVVGTVGNVRAIGVLTVKRLHIGNDDADV